MRDTLTSILGVNIASSTYQTVSDKTIEWARRGESRSLVFANVHVIMEAYDDPAYLRCLNSADMVNPDGVPLVWALKLMGKSDATRVYGPDSTLKMIKDAAANDIPVGFYGGSPEVLQTLLTIVKRDNPSLQVPFAMSPPFRELSEAEEAAIVQQISDSGAKILFIGLGCPRQEKWMMRHVGRIPAVMFAVGAAFDFIAGTKKQAPRWMMKTGLEWVFRLVTEPRRLAQRYFKHNPRYVFLVARQLMRRGPMDAVEVKE
jgi:N-acetylglucosaminyldiphosphoundecaprenol N-acetyl-beta-D-mannosaminyltransferase